MAPILLFLLAAAEPASLIEDPVWIRKPTGDDLYRLYPRRAMQAQADGRAVVECQVADDGHLADCVVIREEPDGLGFGEATARVSTIFQMKPRSASGQVTIGRRIRIPLRWTTPR